MVVDERIMIELKNFKLGRNSLAYEYLVDCIKVASEDKQAINDFGINVYAKVAKKYHTKANNVQWSVTKLINLMYFNTDKMIIDAYFNRSEAENPSTKAFIIGVAQNAAIYKDFDLI